MTDELMRMIAGVLEQLEGVEFAYLFGSAARADAFPSSDIDIAVYVNKNHISLDVELGIHAALSRGLKSDKVDLLILNNAKNLIILEEIIRHGKVVLDRDPLLRESFELSVLHDAIDFRTQRKVFAGV